MDSVPAGVSKTRKLYGFAALLGLAVAAWLLFPDMRTKLVDAVSGPDLQELFHRDLAWPPKVGEPYPALVLENRHGELVSLEQFRGKVLLIEPIGMSCKGCVAFAGGHERGAFEGTSPQPRLPSIERLLPRFAPGATLSDPDIVLVQILFYDKSMGVPTPEDAARWEDHFTSKAANRVVLVGTKALQCDETFRLIPGFQLVGRDFVLRSDSTGHKPVDDLYKTLLPMIPDVLGESSPMTTEEAYATMPHRRTRFDLNRSRMGRREQVYCERLFSIVDRAMVERIEVSRKLYRGRIGLDEYRERHDSIVASLEALEIPDTLGEAHRNISEAIEHQREYFESWHDALTSGQDFPHAPGKRIREHSAIQGCHQKLLAAYSALKKLFSSDPEHNQRAFFDHLCALDFI